MEEERHASVSRPVVESGQEQIGLHRLAFQVEQPLVVRHLPIRTISTGARLRHFAEIGLGRSVADEGLDQKAAIDTFDGVNSQHAHRGIRHHCIVPERSPSRQAPNRSSALPGAAPRRRRRRVERSRGARRIAARLVGIAVTTEVFELVVKAHPVHPLEDGVRLSLADNWPSTALALELVVHQANTAAGGSPGATPIGKSGAVNSTVRNMETFEVEAFNGQANYAVIRLPSRKFPGVVVAGDSLSILVADLRRGLERLRRGELDDGAEEIAGVLDTMETVQRAYERVLAEHAIPLPVPPPVAPGRRPRSRVCHLVNRGGRR